MSNLTGQALRLSNLQFQKDLETSKSCHVNRKDTTSVLRVSIERKKMKNTIPDLTMIKWSWLGMSVLNCWFRYWIVEMEDGRLRL